MREKEEKLSINDKYIVFIDQGFISRNDVFLVMGDEVPVQNVKKYVNDLSELFSRLEKDYGCEVVVAAHPKSYYSDGTFYKYICEIIDNWGRYNGYRQ